ncbi:hypothetical protein [Actinomadura sp. SCN-SB]|uniref:hypothetical protein n=1 Tax=Actinomadura sp. SCN-SB TaxID=3373092 RepID=UPI0037517A91
MSDTAPWQARMPRSVLDLYCPSDHLVTTPTDRRMLWHLESELAVAATNDRLRRLASDLRRYLNDTCAHHWHEREAEAGIPAHRQCLWCSDVEWIGGETP